MTLDNILDKYYNHFGTNYPIPFPSAISTEEIAADVERCIASNCPAKEIEYDDECDY